MAKSLVLHIGDPKTGSSSIQRALFGHKVECPTVSFDYPPLSSAFVLANTLQRTSSAADRAERFSAYSDWLDQSDADVAIISAEQFSAYSADAVNAAFQEFMPGHAATMRVICYARPHVSRLLSAYAQRTKVGTLDTDLEDFYLRLSFNKFIALHRRVLNWRAVYGERFILRPFIRNELQDGDVVADFMGLVLNGEPFRLLEATMANVSLTYEALSGLRLLQTTLLNQGVSEHSRHTVGSRISTLVAALPTGAGTKLHIGKTLYQRVLAQCMDDAQNLDRDFFGRPLMVPALEQAREEAIEDNLDCNALNFMPRRQIAAIRRNGLALAQALATNPGVWELTFQRDMGHKPQVMGNETFSAEAQKTIATVDNLLAEAAALLTDGGAGPEVTRSKKTRRASRDAAGLNP